jgi:hypothetical protein
MKVDKNFPKEAFNISWKTPDRATGAKWPKS